MKIRKLNKENCFVLFLVIFFALSIFASLFFGVEKISFKDFIYSLKTNDFSLLYIKTIILKIRLPRTILVIISGILLGGSGAVLQGFFRNPLADSSILGISSGAAFGGAIGSVISANIFSSLTLINSFAFAGAVVSVIILLIFSRLSSSLSSVITLLLTGTALSSLFSAGASIVILLKSRELRAMYVWTLGSFNGRGWTELKFIIIPAIISFIILIFVSRFLDVLTSGEKEASLLGLNLKMIMTLILIGASLATASSVCSGGIIAFVGLISPHIVRNFCQIQHKKIIPFSMLTGAVILLLSDIATRIIMSPMELPIGIITSIIGAPIFLHILFTGSNRINND